MKKMGFLLIRLSLMMRKDVGNKICCLRQCRLVIMDNDYLVFSDKKLNSSISDYFISHSLDSEKDSDVLFTVLCHSWKVLYFDGRNVKRVLPNPNGNTVRKITV